MGTKKLTTFVSEHRARFLETFPVESWKGNQPYIVLPSRVDPNMVGSAADYLIRFYIERTNANVGQGGSWVAHKILHIWDNKENLDIATSILAKAEHDHYRYIQSGYMTDNLIRSAIRLSRLDLLRRAGPGMAHYLRDPIPLVVVQELRKLYNAAVDSKVFVSNDRCILNPTLGRGHIGADADLVIGDTLIDIKTVKDLTFIQGQYNQLIGYYLLCEIGALQGKIKNVGIYYARHGYMHIVPVSKFKQREGFDEFQEWFWKSCELSPADIRSMPKMFTELARTPVGIIKTPDWKLICTYPDQRYDVYMRPVHRTTKQWGKHYLFAYGPWAKVTREKRLAEMQAGARARRDMTLGKLAGRKASRTQAKARATRAKLAGKKKSRKRKKK